MPAAPSTRVRLAPRPRRSAVDTPPPGLLDAAVVLGISWGRSLMIDSTLTLPLSFNSCALTIAIGDACCRSGRAMREPVTTMVSLVAPSSAALVCAKAGVARPSRMVDAERRRMM